MVHLAARALVVSVVALAACATIDAPVPEPRSRVDVATDAAFEAANPRHEDAAAALDAGGPGADAAIVDADASLLPADDYEEGQRIDSGLSELQDRMRVCLTKAKIETAAGVGVVLRIDRSGAVREARIVGRAHLWNDQTITAATAECFLDLARHARFGPLRREHPEERMMAP